MSVIITKAIITALKLEADLIIEKFWLTETKVLWSLSIYQWVRTWDEQEDENIVLLICWEGKTQSAFATTYLCENYNPDKIVNIWIVWNLNHETLSIGDVIMPHTFVQHDFYMPDSIDFSAHLREPIFLEYAIWEEYDLEKFSLHLSGICATGDQFIDNADLKSEIVERYGADIVDMEAYSILSILKNYDLLDKTVVIKSVSDGADDKAEENSMDNLNLAMKNAVAILDFTL
jgi:adenosylhomocysteine nucleosidase